MSPLGCYSNANHHQCDRYWVDKVSVVGMIDAMASRFDVSPFVTRWQPELMWEHKSLTKNVSQTEISHLFAPKCGRNVFYKLHRNDAARFTVRDQMKIVYLVLRLRKVYEQRASCIKQFDKR